MQLHCSSKGLSIAVKSWQKICSTPPFQGVQLAKISGDWAPKHAADQKKTGRMVERAKPGVLNRHQDSRTGQQNDDLTPGKVPFQVPFRGWVEGPGISYIPGTSWNLEYPKIEGRRPHWSTLAPEVDVRFSLVFTDLTDVVLKALTRHYPAGAIVAFYFSHLLIDINSCYMLLPYPELPVPGKRVLLNSWRYCKVPSWL